MRGEEEGRGRREGGKLREGEWVEVDEVREEGVEGDGGWENEQYSSSKLGLDNSVKVCDLDDKCEFHNLQHTHSHTGLRGSSARLGAARARTRTTTGPAETTARKNGLCRQQNGESSWKYS